MANVAEDGSDEFSRQASIRATARKAFAEHDVGSRTARAVLRKAAPVVGPYSVGDVVCFRKRPTEGDVSAKWSTGSRIVGFDGKNVWVITEGVPVCVATDRLRPCTAAEALAYEYLTKHHDGGMTRYAPPEGQQQSFVDECRNLSESGPAVPQEPVQLPVIHEEVEILNDSLMEEYHPVVAGEHDDDDGYEAGDAPAEEPWIEPRPASQAAAASAPVQLRTPLQRSLMDDVPHDMRGRNEVMRRRTDGGSSASGSEPAPEPENPLLDMRNRTGTG